MGCKMPLLVDPDFEISLSLFNLNAGAHMSPGAFPPFLA